MSCMDRDGTSDFSSLDANGKYAPLSATQNTARPSCSVCPF